MPVAYQKAAEQAGVKLQVKGVNTLPSQDPEGVVPGLTMFVILLSGYLGATFAMQRTNTAARHYRVLALLGYAVLAALVIDLIAGPILGAYANVGSNFWKLWPEFASRADSTSRTARALSNTSAVYTTLAPTRPRWWLAVIAPARASGRCRSPRAGG
jgi:hypothetical protein